ncbi:uncharacterized membrane protein YhaH (DUF805 family) [Bradyrhizobium sp. USDA 4341]
MIARNRHGAVGYGLAAVFGAQGRIGRVQFGLSVIYQSIISAIVGGLILIFVGGPMITGGAGMDDITGIVAFALIGLVAELATTSLLFFSVRARLNDIGVSNWWTIPMSVPSLVWLAGGLMYSGLTADVIQSLGAFGSIAVLVALIAYPGTQGTNAYGDPPRSPTFGALQPGNRPPALN